MRLMRVFDRQIMQAERLLNMGEQRLGRFVQPNPEKAIGMPPSVSQIGNGNDGDADAVAIRSGVDDAVRRQRRSTIRAVGSHDGFPAEDSLAWRSRVGTPL